MPSSKLPIRNTNIYNKNHNKQMPILFKIYADSECSLKRFNSYEGEHTIKYQELISLIL